ncbi:MAG TPA: hypothetical protein VN029_13620 [Sphingomonas sp.]|nr:hypothetical protein [Sphingomonas sp.]
MPDDPIIAIGLLTRRDLDRLGQSFAGAIPVPSDTVFEDLLAQLDHVEVARMGKGILLRADTDKAD